MFRPSKQQMQIMRHALGLGDGGKEYRNHFVAGEGHADQEDLLELCRENLMYRVPNPPSWIEGDLFMVNNEGKALVRGEHTGRV